MAIIGHGDIASVLTDREGVCFFASGVSNSAEVERKIFAREIDLLKQQPKDHCLFYFSTISVFNEERTPYQRHKYCMEAMVRYGWDHYVILRIGNITWGENPNTFLNKMRAMKKAGTPLPVHDEWKYMIGRQHFLMLTQSLPINGKIEICAFSYMAKVKDLL